MRAQAAGVVMSERLGGDRLGGRTPVRRTVLAAGVLCWRPGPRGLEVLMVHRPRYDDWSWPKGKLEPDELLPVCALRELAEETGVEARLGRPLPTVRYLDHRGAEKRVSYWAGTVLRTGARTASRHEIDDAAWVPVAEAAERLTADTDRAPLEALLAHHRADELDTVPVLVVRHATARPRDSWARADAERPLVASGQRQAAALVPLLRCWRPEHVLSSPWKRCLQTVAPYEKLFGVRVRTKGGLSERGFRRAPKKAAKHLTGLLLQGRPAAMCTHRPVLAGVLEALALRTAPDQRHLVPDEDPRLAPGEVLVAHVVKADVPRPVVAVEQHAVAR